MKIRLKKLTGLYAVAQINQQEKVPDWVDGDGFVSISRTDDELSLVCLQQRIPPEIKMDKGWICFKFQGPFAFGEAEVILSIIRPLSENGIGKFVVSTFNGDMILIKLEDVPTAIMLLKEAGHTIE